MKKKWPIVTDLLRAITIERAIKKRGQEPLKEIKYKIASKDIKSDNYRYCKVGWVIFIIWEAIDKSSILVNIKNWLIKHQHNIFT